MLKLEEMTREMTYFKYDFSGPAMNLCEARYAFFYTKPGMINKDMYNKGKLVSDHFSNIEDSVVKECYINFDIFFLSGFTFSNGDFPNVDNRFLYFNGIHEFLIFKSEEEMQSFINILAKQQMHVRNEEIKREKARAVSNRIKI